MEPQERDLITTLLGRLKSVAGQAKEPEADGLIRQAVAEQPDAPYYLVQTVLIQDLSLHNAQHRIAELEQQLNEAQQQTARPTSFLGGLFGSRQPQPVAPPAAGSVPAPGPWTRAPQVAAAPMAQPYGQPSPQGGPAQPQGGYGGQPGGGFFGGGMGGSGGGFLRSAAATAAGVAGGALLFQGIESLFGRGGGGILGGQAGMTPGLGETVVNNYYGGDAGGGGGQDFSSGDAGGGQDYGGGGQDYSSGQDYGGGGQDYSSGQDYGGGQDYSSDQDFGGGDFGGGDSGGDNFSC
jgi:hypothetical protein